METGTLKELNVQPGDIVTLHGEDRPNRTIRGWVGDDCYATDHEFGGPAHLYSGAIFRLVSRAAPTGPVRTVTRSEIVPGIYNRLGVGEQSGDRIWVGLVENDGDYDLGSLLDAKQLRALAATATEIADALEAPTQ